MVRNLRILHGPFGKIKKEQNMDDIVDYGGSCSPSMEAIPEDQEGCWNCRFMFKKSYANFCRRLPPVWADDNWAFPVVDVDDWCGEWEEKE
jgi:hypothetical protein